MRDSNNMFAQQDLQAFMCNHSVRRMVDPELFLESAQPVLLSLARDAIDPTIFKNLDPQTFENRRCSGLKTPPMVLGA